MKAKIKIPDSVLAVALALIIISLGIFAINSAGKLIPDYRDTVVTLDVPEAAHVSSRNEYMPESYPWTLLNEQIPYTGGMPAWLEQKVIALIYAFPAAGEISLSETELYLENNIYFIKNIKLKDLPSNKELTMSAAFEVEGGLVAFNIDPVERGSYDAGKVNECYRTICDSAEFHRLNGSATELTYILGLLQNGMFESEKEEYYDPANPVTLVSDSILYADPISDFYYSYCSWLANFDDHSDALQIIAIINNESPKSYYRDGKIYLCYENRGLGELSLCWDMETYLFSGMTLKTQ